MAVQPDDSKTVIACIESWGHYPAKTTSEGRSWNPIENLPPNSSAVAFDPRQPGTIFVGEGWHSGSEWGSNLRLTFKDVVFNTFKAVFKFSIL